MYICHNEDRYWGQYRKFGAFSQRKCCISHMHTHNKIIIIIINTNKLKMKLTGFLEHYKKPKSLNIGDEGEKTRLKAHKKNLSWRKLS